MKRPMATVLTMNLVDDLEPRNIGGLDGAITLRWGVVWGEVYCRQSVKMIEVRSKASILRQHAQ